MTGYTVTFSNGSSRTIANSVKQYSHAWIVVGRRRRTDGTAQDHTEIGFARTSELAYSAAGSVARRLKKPLPYASHDLLPKGTPGEIIFCQVREVQRI